MWPYTGADPRGVTGVTGPPLDKYLGVTSHL